MFLNTFLLSLTLTLFFFSIKHISILKKLETIKTFFYYGRNKNYGRQYFNEIDCFRKILICYFIFCLQK